MAITPDGSGARPVGEPPPAAAPVHAGHRASERCATLSGEAAYSHLLRVPRILTALAPEALHTEQAARQALSSRTAARRTAEVRCGRRVPSSARAAARTARRTSSFAKRRRRALGPRRGGRDRLVAEEVPAVEAEQRESSLESGSGISRGEVDASGSLRQGDLEVLDAVRRQQERHVGIGVESVKRVEHLEEQRRGPIVKDRSSATRSTVLEHDDRGLVRPRDLRRGRG